MSFGVVQSAIASIKLNRSLLTKNSKRGILQGSYSKVKLEFPNTSSREDLIRLRHKLIKERKQRRIKQTVVYIVILVVLFSLLIIYT